MPIEEFAKQFLQESPDEEEAIMMKMKLAKELKVRYEEIRSENLVNIIYMLEKCFLKFIAMPNSNKSLPISSVKDTYKSGKSLKSVSFASETFSENGSFN